MTWSPPVKKYKVRVHAQKNIIHMTNYTENNKKEYNKKRKIVTLMIYTRIIIVKNCTENW